MSNLVTVITATYNRPDLLLNRCIPSVLNQTYDNIEYYVISDGPNSDLENAIKDRYPSVKYHQFSRHWGQYNPPPPNWNDSGNWGSFQRLFGTFIAQGEYLCYLDDDNEFLPNHVEKLVNHIEVNNVDFVYSKIQCRDSNNCIFSNPPAFTGIDTNVLLHKYHTFSKCMWGYGYPADWFLVDCWMKKGFTWSALDEITVIKG